uniref:Putative group i salivary lipocalin n=1 Tax=Rhipicephalus pulchellus TaxID=72859 RepID=L7LRM0_RHIPC
MVQKLVFKLILYAGCLSVLDGNCWSCKKASYSIKEFFSTPEPIWTYMTSGNTNLRCLVDQVNVMEQKLVTFTRSCYNKGYKVSRLFYGFFDKYRKKHMDVKPQGKGINFQEDLIFMSDDKSCAVILVTTKVCAKRFTYDLRVRNSHIRHSPHPKCLHVYEKFERHGIVVYDPSCQGILAKVANSKVYEPQQDRCGSGMN